MTCSKKVCRECPFRKQSAPGYLGSASHQPEKFLDPHYHGKERLPCHMLVDWENDAAGKTVEDAPLCRGFLVFMKNNCKYPENSEVRDALTEIKPDRSDIFSMRHEFIEHHNTGAR